MKSGLEGIMLAPTKHFFFHAPDKAICGSMHDCSDSELHNNLTLCMQQMLGSIFWVETLTEFFTSLEEVKVKLYLLFFITMLNVLGAHLGIQEFEDVEHPRALGHKSKDRLFLGNHFRLPLKS